MTIRSSSPEGGATGAPVAPTGSCWWPDQPGRRPSERRTMRAAWDRRMNLPQALTVTCGSCNGSKGAWVGSEWHKCGNCNGSGTVEQ